MDAEIDREPITRRRAYAPARPARFSNSATLLPLSREQQRGRKSADARAYHNRIIAPHTRVSFLLGAHAGADGPCRSQVTS